MTYKIMITVHDSDLIDVMEKLGNKRGKYLLLALGEFLRTSKGKKVLSLMIKESPIAVKDKKSIPRAEERKKPPIDLDSFL